MLKNKDIVSSSASTTLDRKENLPNLINIPSTSSNAGSLEKKSSNLTKEISENIDMKDVEVHEKIKEDNTGSRDGLPACFGCAQDCNNITKGETRGMDLNNSK